MTAYPTMPADPTSVVGRRILAYGIDLLLCTFVVIAALYPMFMDRSIVGDSDSITCSNTGTGSAFEQPSPNSNLCIELGDGRVRYVPASEANTLTSLMYLTLFGTQALNLVLLQGLTGASIGKLLVGLRVVRADGQRAGMGWIALRWLLLFVDAFCCFLPGAVMVFSTKGHRRLGDMAASTFVVARKSVGTPIPASVIGTAALAPGAGWPQPVGGAGWAPPGAPPAMPPATPTDGPIWDEGRNTYIQFDRSRDCWVQWVTAASEWRPLDQ